MADEKKQKTVEENPFGPQEVKNKAQLRDSIAAAKRWPPCPKCGNEVHNTAYSTLAETKPGATPVTVNMMECASCGERVNLKTGERVKRETEAGG